MKLKRVGNRLCRGATVLQTVECSCGQPFVYASNCCTPRQVGFREDTPYLFTASINAQGLSGVVGGGSGGYSYDRTNTLGPLTLLDSLPACITVVRPLGNAPTTQLVLVTFSLQSSYLFRISAEVSTQGVYEFELLPNGSFTSRILSGFPGEVVTDNTTVTVTRTVPGTSFPAGILVNIDSRVVWNNGTRFASFNGTVTAEILSEDEGDALFPCPPAALLGPERPDDPRAILTPERAFQGGCCGQ